MGTSSQITQDTRLDAFDGSCYNGAGTTSPTSRPMEAAINAINSCATITQVRMYHRVDLDADGVSDTVDWKFTHGVGTTQCPGHTYTDFATPGRTCGTTGFVLLSVICTHSSWFGTPAQYNNNGSMRNYYQITAVDGTGINWMINFFYNIVTYYDSVPSTPGLPSKWGANQTDITVNRPSYSGSQGITHWQVDGQNGASDSGDLSIGTVVWQHVPSNLSPGLGYNFRVRTKNTCGSLYGGWSGNTLMYTKTVKPNNPTVTPDAAGQLRVDWTTVTGAGTWNVSRSTSGTGSWNPVTGSPFSGGTLTFDDTGLGNGNTWYYRLQAVTPDGTGSTWTDNNIGDTTWTIPGNMSTPTRDSSTTTSITWDWTTPSLGSGTPPAPLTDYEYQWKIHNGSYSGDVSAGVSPLTETKPSGIVHNTDYRIKMVAVNDVGQSAAYSGELTIYSTPDVPTGLTITADAVLQLRIDWNAVVSDLATGGTTYDVEYSTNGSSKTGDIILDTSGITTDDDSLGIGEERWYRVRATNTQVDGDFTAGWTAGTSWGVPGNADLSNATTDEFSQVTVTKAVSDPSDGAGTPPEPIDLWFVWRADTEFGSYADISGPIAIGTTTYIDFTIAGGETKWYKSKYNNLAGTGAISTNGTSGTATEITDQSAGDLLSESRIKTIDLFVKVGIPHIPESQWDFNTINEGDDQVGTTHLVDKGAAPTFSDTGGVFSGGYADMGASDGTGLWWANMPAAQTGISANQAFTYITFVQYKSLDANTKVLAIQGDTNGHKIETGIQNNINWGFTTRSKTSSSGGGSFSVPTISTDTWYLVALGHNPSNDKAFFWFDETFHETDDQGDYDFSEANSTIVIGSNPQTVGQSADAWYSHARLYPGLIPTLTDIQHFKANGEFLTAGTEKPTAASRVKAIGQEVLHNPGVEDLPFYSDSRVKILDQEVLSSHISELFYSAADVFHEASDHPFSGEPPVLGETYFGHLDKDATGRVKIINQEVWHNPTQFEYYSTGDPITSDSWVEKIGEISRVSDTAILNVQEILHNPGVEDEPITVNSAVHRPGFDKVKNPFDELYTADSRIKREGFAKVTPLPTSRTRIIKTLEVLHNPGIEDLPIEAASTVFHPAWGLVVHDPLGDATPITSDSRIVIEGTLMIPPMYSDSWILWAADDHDPGTIGHLDATADTFVIYVYEVVHNPGVENAPITGDSAIHRPGYDLIEPTADSAVFRASYGLIEPQSNSAIFVASENRVDALGLIEPNSNTRIIRRARRSYPLQDKSKDSVSTIRKTMPKKVRKSNSLVIVRPADGVDSLPPITSDTLVVHNLKASDPMYSDTLVIVITKIDPPVYSNTRVKVFDQEITPILGDSAVFRTGYDTIDIIANTLIHSEPMINISSDSKILKIFEISNIIADTYVINLGTEIPIDSNTAIFRTAYELINVKSYAAVYKAAHDPIEIDSEAIVLVTQKIPVIYSDTAIRRDRSPIVAIFEKSRQL